MVNFDDLDLDDVRITVISQYETETNRGQHKGAHNANKLTAVKRKHGNPRFSQQDCSQQPQASPSTPNQQQHKQHGSRGNKGRGGKPGPGKGKQRA